MKRKESLSKFLIVKKEKAPFLEGNEKITFINEPFRRQDPERRSKRLQKKQGNMEHLYIQKQNQYLRILSSLDFKNMFICACSNEETVFLNEKDFKTHADKCHRAISYPNSTHDFYRHGIRYNKYFDKEILLQLKCKQINRKIRSIQQELGISRKLTFPQIKKREQILFPLPLKPIYYHSQLKKNYMVSKVFCWQDLLQNNHFNVKFLNARSWYCSYCKIFFYFYTFARANFQLSLIQHIRNHNSTKILKFIRFWEQEKEEMEKVKKGKQMITCPCTRPVFRNYEDFFNHVMQEHGGKALEYSSHLVDDKNVYLNPEFSQKQVVRSQLLPIFYLCGFCYETNSRQKIFLSSISYIQHIKTYHKPPYMHYLNSHFFDISKQSKDNKYFQSYGIIEQDLSFTYLGSYNNKSTPIALKLPRQKVIDSLNVLRAVERQFSSDLSCRICKSTFQTKQLFFQKHQLMSEQKKIQHYDQTDFFFIKICDDAKKDIIVPIDEKYISEFLQNQQIYYLCGCQHHKKIALHSFIIHVLEQHQRAIYLMNDSY